MLSAVTKKVSATEMQSRCEKGLCYYCDKRFSPGHRSTKKVQIFLIEEPEDVAAEASKEPNPDYHETPIEVS
ncbi:hypothetical protein MRB53_021777 [Persea americana]|uniref:Uncharacterized protein n=1 Tax=Persea americana TaxID=3435 RepID=A0ACC2L4W9_PERAE|nr:hypothetical protein MRB53_021777 [Persea americana]